VKKLPRPDFGISRTSHEGVELECRCYCPGLTLHDLTMIAERAKKEAKPGDEYAGDPSKWPDVRAVRAVADAVLNSIFEPELK